MDKLLKRSLTLLLAFVMVFTMMPMTAMAYIDDFRIDRNHIQIRYDGESVKYGTPGDSDADFTVHCSNEDYENIIVHWYSEKNERKELNQAPKDMGNYSVVFTCKGQQKMEGYFLIESGVAITVPDDEHPGTVIKKGTPVTIGTDDSFDIVYDIQGQKEDTPVTVEWYGVNPNTNVLTLIDEGEDNGPKDEGKYLVKVSFTDTKDETVYSEKMFYIKNKSTIAFYDENEFVYDSTAVNGTELVNLKDCKYAGIMDYYWEVKNGENFEPLFDGVSQIAGPTDVGTYRLTAVAQEVSTLDKVSDYYAREVETKEFEIVPADPIITLTPSYKYYDGKKSTIGDLSYLVQVQSRAYNRLIDVKESLLESGSINLVWYDRTGEGMSAVPQNEGEYYFRLNISDKDKNYNHVIFEECSPANFAIRTADTDITAYINGSAANMIDVSYSVEAATYSSIPSRNTLNLTDQGEMNHGTFDSSKVLNIKYNGKTSEAWTNPTASVEYYQLATAGSYYKWTSISEDKISYTNAGRNCFLAKISVSARGNSAYYYNDSVNYAAETEYVIFEIEKLDGNITFDKTKALTREYSSRSSLTVGTASNCDIVFDYNDGTDYSDYIVQYYKVATDGSLSGPTYHATRVGTYRVVVTTVQGKYHKGTTATYGDFVITKNTTYESFSLRQNKSVIKYVEGREVTIGFNDPTTDLSYDFVMGGITNRHTRFQYHWYKLDGNTYTPCATPSNVGTYAVGLELKEGYCYAAKPEVKYTFTISAGDPSIAVTNNVVIYDGQPVEVATSGDNVITYEYNGDGEVNYTFHKDNNGSMGAVINAPTDAGTYWIGLYAGKGTKYAEASKVYQQITIQKSQPTVTISDLLNETIVFDNKQITYGLDGDQKDFDIEMIFKGQQGEQVTDTNMLSKLGFNVSFEQNKLGQVKLLDAGENPKDVALYTMTVSTDESKNYYATSPSSITFRIKYDTSIEFTNVTSVYDGQYVTAGRDSSYDAVYVVKKNHSTVGTTTMPVNIAWTGTSSATTAPVNAGTNYTVTASIEATDEYIAYTTTADYSVTQLPVVVAWGNTSFVYNGYAQHPVATVTNLQNNVLNGNAKDVCTVSSYVGAVTNSNAVSGYTPYAVTVSNIDNPNYTLVNANVSTTYTIAQLVAQIVWGNNSFVYNGQLQKPTATIGNLKGYDTQAAAPIVVLNGATDSNVKAGNTKYTAAASFANIYNYTLVGATHTTEDFTIAQKPVKIDWTNNTPYTYNASVRCPEAVVSPADLIAGDKCTVNVTGGQKNANQTVNDYQAYAASLSNLNYVFDTLADRVEYFRINKKAIGVEWGNTKFTYNTGVQVPVATAQSVETGDTVNVTVIGGQIDVGTYVATASSLDNTNYELSGVYTTSFLINSQENSAFNGGAAAAGGGGGGGAVISKTTINTVAHGTIKANPSVVYLGGKLTITATPDEGYELGTLIVNGSAVTGTKNADGTVTYVINKVSSKTEISGTFVEKKAEEKPAEETPVVTYTDENAKTAAAAAVIKARSVRTAKGVKVTISGDENVEQLLANGYTVEYKFYKSVKAKSGYAYKLTKKTNVYTNTTDLKVGTRYYFKARLVVKNASGEVVYTTPLKQCKYATRVIK